MLKEIQTLTMRLINSIKRLLGAEKIVIKEYTGKETFDMKYPDKFAGYKNNFKDYNTRKSVFERPDYTDIADSTDPNYRVKVFFSEKSLLNLLKIGFNYNEHKVIKGIQLLPGLHISPGATPSSKDFRLIIGDSSKDTSPVSTNYYSYPIDSGSDYSKPNVITPNKAKELLDNFRTNEYTVLTDPNFKLESISVSSIAILNLLNITITTKVEEKLDFQFLLYPHVEGSADLFFTLGVQGNGFTKVGPPCPPDCYI